MRLLVAAAAGALLLSSGAFAQTTVAGWTIGHDNNGDCQAAYSYKDAEDDNAENSVVISLVEEKGRKVPDVYVILAYEKWDWDKGEETKTEVLVDKKVYASGHSWISPSKNLLISRFVNQLDRFVRAFAEARSSRSTSPRTTRKRSSTSPMWARRLGRCSTARRTRSRARSFRASRLRAAAARRVLFAQLNPCLFAATLKRAESRDVGPAWNAVNSTPSQTRT
jgi:hypothetical protein